MRAHHHRRHRRGHRRRGRGSFGRGRFFGPGEVRLALLDLLVEEPRHGYDLMKALEERSGGAYRASAGTIYPTLQLLEDEGLATAEAVDGKRVYRPTEAGRERVTEEREVLDEIWQRAEDWSEWGPWGGLSDPEAAEVLRPVMRLAKAAVRAATRDPGAVEEIREILRQARRDIQDLRRSA
jgi:DNA-binding PadR family transcriptional regulator